MYTAENIAGLPPIQPGDHITVMAADSPTCGYGAPLAIELRGITYVDSIYGGDVGGYRPETWSTHETIRWLALLGGFGIAAIGLLGVLRWLG